MQLQEMEVTDLFGHFNHRIPFPTRSEEERTPAIVILHGPNGVGKTTILRMLDGFMKLDFTSFRRVPFRRASLRFTTGQEITVRRASESMDHPLEVQFMDLSVVLHPKRRGPNQEADAQLVEAFRNRFFAETAPITFNFIEASRFPAPTDDDDDPGVVVAEVPYGFITREVHRARRREAALLADRVAAFIREAQVNSRQFFSSAEASLFARIVDSVTSHAKPNHQIDEMISALASIKQQDEANLRFGLEPDVWDFELLVQTLRSLPEEPGRDYALAVIDTYLEVLESRANERRLVADRLRAFEEIMKEFLLDKQVAIDARRGLRIVAAAVERDEQLSIPPPQARTGKDAGNALTVEETNAKSNITEQQLSSGEYQLLYLMTAAVTTRRRGTVIAIDEPEMSMHISWQRKLVRNLVKCASNASPQFVFATHSPDIVADYADCLVDFGASLDRG